MYAVVTLYVSISDASQVRFIDIDPLPNGSFVAVMPSGSFTGVNLGTACGVGPALTFDPNATRQLSAGVSPYSGTFQAFLGSPDLRNIGSSASLTGPWVLEVGSGAGPLPVSTTINCWQLDVYTTP
ncbi:MAG TPA: hypothetical protein VFB52_07365 [Solirubrobacterales bacterium]|nr:hypothetical protein [Solirubrobacterales bacterium]